MNNDKLANIAVTVTVAMLATATVAFAMSSAGLADPIAEDLPVVRATAGSAAPAGGAPNAGVGGAGDVAVQAPGVDQTFEIRTAGPRTFASGGHVATASQAPGDPAGSGTRTSSSSAASSSAGGPAGTGKVSEHEDDSDEHELVKPKVRETEDPEDPEDEPEPPEVKD
jgi:hypothetical protein